MHSVAETNRRVPAPYQLKPGPYSSHSRLLALLPADGRGRRVLDVGCAGGYLAAILAQRGYCVTGIDRPGRMALDFPPEIEPIEADLDRGLPPLAGGFDYVLCADVLEHLREPARMLSQLRACLNPGGRLVASLPNSGHFYFRWNVLLGRFPAHDRGLFDRTHLHFYTWSGWTDLLAGAGFAIDIAMVSGVPVGLAFPGKAGCPVVRALERLSYESARLWKKLFAYQFIVSARPEALP